MDVALFLIGLPVVGYITSNHESFSKGARIGTGIVGIVVFVGYVMIRLF